MHRSYKEQLRIMTGGALAVCLLAGQVATASPMASSKNKTIDLILYGGKISTVDDQGTEAEAVAIRGGDIVATGSDHDMLTLAGPATRTLDLQGRRVLPGLIDGHLHGLRLGYHCFSSSVRLDAVFTRREALAAYLERVRSRPAGSWIVTHGGWIPQQFTDDGRMFTLAELDAIAPDHPLYVRYLGYDGAMINSAALRLLNLPPDTPGLVLEGNKPTGQLKTPPRGAPDAAQWAFAIAGRAIETQFNAQSIEDQARCLSDFIAEGNRLGLTAWVDPDGNQQPYNLVDGACRSFAVEEHGRQAVIRLRRRHELNARIGFYTTPPFMGGLEAVRADTRLDMTDLGDDRLRMLGMGEDLFCPGNRPQPPEIRFDDIMTLIAQRGSGLKIHASGFDTQLFYLDSWEKVNKVYPLAPLRWTIGHPGEDGKIPQQSLDRIKALGIGIDTSTVASLGLRPPAPFRRIYESGVRWCMSTDSTAGSSYAPFVKLWFAISGKTLNPAIPGLEPDQRLTRTQALRASTVNCAWHMGQEGRLGSLEPGKHADLIVLNDDYMSVPVDHIKTLYSVLTLVDGEVVYRDESIYPATGRQ